MGIAFLTLFTWTMAIIAGIGVIICIIDIVKNEFIEPNNKIIWLLVMLLAPPIGLILYPLIGKEQKIKKEILKSKIMWKAPEKPIKPEKAEKWF